MIIVISGVVAVISIIAALRLIAKLASDKAKAEIIQEFQRDALETEKKVGKELIRHREPSDTSKRLRDGKF